MNKGAGRWLVAVASGKGGVGKTSLTLNLAALAARQGQRVLLFDGDTGLANADVQLNVQPVADLAMVLHGNASLRAIVTPVPTLSSPRGGKVDLLAGRAGDLGLAHLSQPVVAGLLRELGEMSEDYDLTLIDVAAGVAPTQLQMCAAANLLVLVTTPDPAALTDAYAVLKLLWQQHGVMQAQLVVNMASAAEAKMVHQRLEVAGKNFLKLPPLPLLGQVPNCKQFGTAVRQHALAAVRFPNSPAVAALADIVPQLRRKM